MNTFVVGSRGFLGFFAVQELLARGHTVRSISLHPASRELNVSASVELVLGDLNATPDDTLREIAEGRIDMGQLFIQAVEAKARAKE